MLCVEQSGSVRRRSGWNCSPRRATTLPYSACYRQTRTGRHTTRIQSASSPTSTPFCCGTRALRRRAVAVSPPAVSPRRRQRIPCRCRPSPRACWCTSSSSSSRRQRQWPGVYRRARQPSSRLLAAAPTHLAYKPSSSCVTFMVADTCQPSSKGRAQHTDTMYITPNSTQRTALINGSTNETT